MASTSTTPTVATTPGGAPLGTTLLHPTTRSPEVLSSTVFAQESVRRLRESDFTLDAKELVCLKYDDCILVLFYSENRESKNVALLWAQAAAQVGGPVFAACNLLMEKRVGEAFMRLSMDPNHPLHWAGMRQVPTIIVYRKGWPKAFYNGDRTVETFSDYALTLACQGDYEEHQQLFSGTQSENRYEMTAPQPSPPRTVSTEFKGNAGVRGYDARFTPVIRGSAEETAEINAARAQRPQTGPAPAKTGGPPPAKTAGGAPAKTGIPIAPPTT